MTRPLLARRLCRGDLIGIPTPAGPAPLARLQEGVSELTAMGFGVRLGPLATAAQPGERLAGDDTARAAEINQMWRDPEVRAVICARGGYGTSRLLDRLDYAALLDDPKIIVGFSDVTALLLAAWRQTSLVCFHGRMAGQEATWLPHARTSLHTALTSTTPLGLIPAPSDGPQLTPIWPGRATGRLIGGNLSLIAALAGTPYGLLPGDYLLLLEDVNEAIYRIDRMLTTLRLGGLLERVRGIVFAETMGVPDPAGVPQPAFVRALRGFCEPQGLPCYYGLAAGHGKHQTTLPLGVMASMDADNCSLTLLEPALIE